MGIPLSETALRLVDGKNYAVLATVNPDGSPQTSVVWVGRDGDDLLFSTVEGRVKHRNMLRDPRVSVTVIDSSDPENYVELRGRVSMTPDIGRRVDTQLSWKYDGRDPGEDRPGRGPRGRPDGSGQGHRLRRLSPVPAVQSGIVDRNRLRGGSSSAPRLRMNVTLCPKERSLINPTTIRPGQRAVW